MTGVALNQSASFRIKQSSDKETPIPLYGVDAQCDIVQFGSRVTLTQLYRFKKSSFEFGLEQKKTEAIYTFPLDSNAAVCGFDVFVEEIIKDSSGNERMIIRDICKGVVKENEVAKQEYIESQQQNNMSALLEQERPNVFTIRLTTVTLCELTQVRVRLTYVSELKLGTTSIKSKELLSDKLQTNDSNDDDDILAMLDGDVDKDEKEGEKSNSQNSKMEFTIPMTIIPKYSSSINKDSNPVGEDLEYTPTNRSSYGMKFDVNIQMNQDIHAITSSTHSVQVEMESGSKRRGKVHINNKNSVAMNTDFVLTIETDQFQTTDSVIEVSNNKESTDEKYSIMVPIVGDLKHIENVNSEIIFLIDCSGSMGWSNDGSKILPIEKAKEAMMIFLQSLSVGVKINIIKFGSSHTSLFSQSQMLTEETLQKAKKYVQQTSANLGGTEIYTPLEDIYKKVPSRGYSRQVFVLTDGAVSNTEGVLALTNKHKQFNRVFSFGIGDCDHYLVNGMAKAGGGHAEILKKGENITEKVVSTLSKALKPSFTNLEVTFPKEAKLKKSFLKVPTVYNDSRSLIYFLAKDLPNEPFDILVSGIDFYGKEFEQKVRIDKKNAIEAKPSTGILPSSDEVDTKEGLTLTSHSITNKEGLVHILASRKLIEQLEDLKDDKDREGMGFDNKKSVDDLIKKLGVKYQLVSSQTSFIAKSINETNQAETSQIVQIESTTVPLQFGNPSNYRGSIMRKKGGVKGSRGLLNLAKPSIMSMKAPRQMSRAPVASSFSLEKSAAAPSFAPFRKSKKSKESKVKRKRVGGIEKKSEEKVVFDEEEEDYDINVSLKESASLPNSLNKALLTQQMNGEWKYSKELINNLTLDSTKIAEEVSKNGDLNRDVLMTAIVIVALAKKFNQFKLQWQLIAKKGMSYLQKQSEWKKCYQIAKQLV